MKEESRQSAIPLSSRVSTLVCSILKLHIRHDAAQRFSAYRSVLTKCVSSNSPRWTSTERRRARDQTPCRPRMAEERSAADSPPWRTACRQDKASLLVSRPRPAPPLVTTAETPARLFRLLFLSSYGGWRSPEVSPGHTRDSSRLGQTLRSAHASARDEKLFHDHQRAFTACA